MLLLQRQGRFVWYGGEDGAPPTCFLILLHKLLRFVLADSTAVRSYGLGGSQFSCQCSRRSASGSIKRALPRIEKISGYCGRPGFQCTCIQALNDKSDTLQKTDISVTLLVSQIASRTWLCNRWSHCLVCPSAISDQKVIISININ